MAPILDGAADTNRWQDPTPCERFRDLTGAHPAVWAALIVTLLLVVIS